ncbi:hypothetical protein ACFS27_17345 [Promicromonospora vindobonensis]|uniref:Uncharacterized protein n=1 Tax=Promicromonospora vindobonensis TaxID=195748 RepID=A0ABW5VUK5_9MICO
MSLRPFPTAPDPSPAASSAAPHAPSRATALRWVVTFVCLLAGGALVAIELAGLADPVEMPTTPRWFAAGMAGATALLTLPTGRPAPHWRTILAAGTGAGMLSGSLLAVPHSILMLVVGILNRLTGAEGPFQVGIPWATAGTHLVVTGAGFLLVAWSVVQHRLRHGRCPWCGRVAAEAPAVAEGTRRTLRRLAFVAVLAALPYLVLKLAWGLGSTIGANGDSFDGVTLASPGYGDTVVMGAASVFASVVMGAGVIPATTRQRVLHAVSGTLGVIGSLMLLPVSVAGVVLMVVAPPAADGELMAWIFYLVYGCFIVWGLTLAPLTALYLRATRRDCRRHRPAAPSPGPAQA